MSEEPIKTKYTITDIPGGFLVVREGGYELGVTYGDTWLHVGNTEIGLYQFRKMVETLGDYFMHQTANGYVRKARLRDGIAMIARALTNRLKPHWRRIVDEIAPPEVSELARLVCASTVNDARLLHFAELYTDQWKHLRSDLKKYHACRLWGKLYFFDNEQGLRDDWRTYLCGGTPNKHENKTLDHLSRKVTAGMVDYFKRLCPLDKPVYDNLQLRFFLLASQHFRWNQHRDNVMRATPEQVKEALVETGLNRVRRDMPTNRLREAVSYIMDYPHTRNVNLVNLARLSLDYHTQAAQGRWTSRETLDRDTVLPLLRLDYPTLEKNGITPLRTVGEVVDEGRVMKHCVADYARRCVESYSFLFHIEFDGYTATAEVSKFGSVVQVQGPFHTKNSATAIGEGILSKELVRARKGWEELVGIKNDLHPLEFADPQLVGGDHPY